MGIRITLAALALVSAALPAQARPHHAIQCVETGFVMFPVCGTTADTHVSVREPHRIRQAPEREVRVGEVVGGRPAGCPHAFCGCGASLHLFGRIIPSLNLAANWLRFPRAAPAPKMAAARYGHVMVLEEHVSGDIWMVHDSNSGGHLTRLHARSIAGYTIVNPQGAG